MDDTLIHALANAVKLGKMTIEQVPLPYQEKVKDLSSKEEITKEEEEYVDFIEESELTEL